MHMFTGFFDIMIYIRFAISLFYFLLINMIVSIATIVVAADTEHDIAVA